MRNLLAVLAASLLLTAEAPPPPGLTRYILNGRFDPGDYGWMRGKFADASPKEKAAWQALWAWRTRCVADQVATIRADLAKRGVKATSSIDETNGTGLCGEIGYALPQSDQEESWPAFQSALNYTRPIAQAVVWSSAVAQEAADPEGDLIADQLIARPMTDQVLRMAASWGNGGIKGAPPLNDLQLGIARGMIWAAIARRDHANTAWLKQAVARNGWPTISKVGSRASHAAWLLVQHADDDPVFQFDMVRAIEPLADRGEIARKDYAYLYDRVMLKLTGKQRYGSQFSCEKGFYAPQPLEDAARVDTLRRLMGMGSLAENTAQILKAYGPCPTEVISAPSVKR